MRLKTLRKERSAFESQGALINGSRIDPPESDTKLLKRRAKKSSVPLTPVNIETSSNTHRVQSTPPPDKLLPPPSLPVETAPAPSYHAVETTYLEHGIRINFNPASTAADTKRSNATTENSRPSSSIHRVQRSQTSLHAYPQRSATPRHYLRSAHSIHQHSRTSMADVEQTDTSLLSRTQADQSYLNYCSSSTMISEHVDPFPPSAQPATAEEKPSLAQLIGNDPDLAYMSSLFQKTSTDTARRRSGFRLPPTAHRYSQLTATSNTQQSSHASNNRSYFDSLKRHETMAARPSVTSGWNKIEKDILKHASRIRANQPPVPSTHHQRFSKPPGKDDVSAYSNSSIGVNSSSKRQSYLKAPKSISLEPLKLLLKPESRSLRRTSPSRPTTLVSSHKNRDQANKEPLKRRTMSSISSSNPGHSGTTSFLSDEHLKSSLLSDQSSSTLKALTSGTITNEKTRPPTSFDSGCDDHSSNCSTDSHRRTSLTINQALSSTPSVRFNSVSSTRRSHANKKVSFEEQSLTVIITTSIYM